MLNKIIFFLRFYRIIKYKNKVPWTRLLVFVLFAYSVSGEVSVWEMLFNIMAISGILMSAFSLNDYYDYKILKEVNFVSHLIGRQGADERKIKMLAFLPLSLMSLLVFIDNQASVVLALVLAVIAVFYSLPPVRLKRFGGYKFAHFCAAVGFSQSYFVTGNLDAYYFIFLILTYLFLNYTEMVHVLEEYQKGERPVDKGRNSVLFILKFTPWLTLGISAILAFFNVLFLITAFFSLPRIFAHRKIDKRSDFYKIRRNIYSIFYSPYEFACYAVFGLLGCFK